MKLHAVEPTRLVRHARDRTALGRGHQLEARRHVDDFVAVAHPDFEEAVTFGCAQILDPVEKLGMTPGAYFSVPEFAHGTGFDFPAKLLRHRLHAVADAEHRD